MIDGNILEEEIYSYFSQYSDYTNYLDIQKKYMNIFKNHFEKMEIIFAWAGVSSTTPPVADPFVACTGTIAWQDFIFLPAQNESILDLNISNLLKQGKITLSDPTLLANPVLNPSGIISTSMYISNYNKDTSTRLIAKNFCNEIITQIKSNFVNPTPVVGSHAGIYTGILTMTGIT